MTKTGDAAKPPMDLELQAESLLDSVRARSRELSIAAVAVALAAGGIYLWQQQKHANENKAELALANPASAFFQVRRGALVTRPAFRAFTDTRM